VERLTVTAFPPMVARTAAPAQVVLYPVPLPLSLPLQLRPAVMAAVVRTSVVLPAMPTARTEDAAAPTDTVEALRVTVPQPTGARTAALEPSQANQPLQVPLLQGPLRPRPLASPSLASLRPPPLLSPLASRPLTAAVVPTSATLSAVTGPRARAVRCTATAETLLLTVVMDASLVHVSTDPSLLLLPLALLLPLLLPEASNKRAALVSRLCTQVSCKTARSSSWTR
jgi:hypothetical protein